MIYNVKVRPNSSEQKIVKVNGNELIVYLKKPANENKANLELIKLLKKHLKKDIKILKGKNSKNKIIEAS